MEATVEVIINAGAGSVHGDITEQTLAALFRQYGIEANIRLARSGTEIIAFAKQAAQSDCEIVVAGGGDGTVSGVAGEIIKTGKTLGVLPLGTLNNFSRDLNIPHDLESAVRVIADANVKQIDVGEVNGRIFLNNSSIGFYPRIVRSREKQQQKGRGKWNAAFWATLKIFNISPFLKVRLHLDRKKLIRKTPFVFVGNNDYEMDFFKIGRRESLQAGKISVYFLHREGRYGLFMLALRLLTGRLRQTKDFEEVATDKLTIRMRKRLCLVAFDGEIGVLRTPLRYKSLPGALKVLAPKGQEVP